MKEILIISGVIMIVFTYQSYTQWHSHKEKKNSNNGNGQGLSKG